MSASKRTAERRAQALALARKGRFRSHVAATIGVHRSVFYDWLRDDADFALEYAAAEAEGEEALLAIALLGGDEGKAAQWYLERWRQFRYGRRERHELTGKGGGPIEISDDPEVRRRRLEELLAKATEPESPDDEGAG